MGDGNGTAGYGQGKSGESTKAVEKATLAAQKNLQHITLLEKRTLFSDIDATVCSTRVRLFTAPQGYGVIANGTVREVCRVFGVKDVGSKIEGNTNPMNVVKAAFEALRRAQTPEELAKMRGLKSVDVCSRYFGEK